MHVGKDSHPVWSHKSVLWAWDTSLQGDKEPSTYTEDINFFGNIIL